MKYFKNKDTNEVFAYDETYPNDAPYIQRAIENGWEDITASWPPVQEVTNDQLAEEIRNKRNRLLAETDWVALRAYEQQQAVPTEWLEYRQALRDITTQSGFPESVQFPEKPQ